MLDLEHAVQTALMPNVVTTDSNEKLQLTIKMAMLGLSIPSTWALFAYDAVIAVARGIKATKDLGIPSPSGAMFFAALRSITFNGVSGYVRIE